MKNAPERIFLQAGSHIEPDDDFKEFAADGEVTWNDVRVWYGDVEYIRFDLVSEIIENLRHEISEAVKSCNKKNE